MLKTIAPRVVKREMSIEGQDKTPRKTLQTSTRENDKRKQKQNGELSAVNHYTTSTKFHVLGGELVQAANPTLFARVPYTTPLGTKKLHLIVKNLVYIISNWTHDKYPNVIYIRLKHFTSGYKKVVKVGDVYTAVFTNRIAALELDSVSCTMDESAVRTYELRYAIRDCVTWELPLTAEYEDGYDFEVSVDDNQASEELPLPNPLAFNFEIRNSQ